MESQAQEPTGGWFEGRTHVLPIRVYYEDTDFSGVVYHANYLRFMERGRSEFLRISGAGHRGLFAGSEPLVWAVRRMMIDFDRAARMEDALTVRTSVLELAGARMRLDQSVARMGDILAKATVEVCVITLDGRPRRVPASTRKKLEIFLETR
ncbi:MAG TPA: tol-pal system-associated acyl-CoA thioesterase [Micropepsaceae bacterium]|nr:tol-pal system-associated acyl-CoA thioesterase [Micropepsaceae bacterium]